MQKINLPEKSQILVTRTDRIGDLLISTPVFTAIRKKYPGAYIAALIFKENRELLENHPDIDEVILYDKKKEEKGLWGNWKFARRLARKRFDVVVHLHATNRMHWTTWLAGIPARIGWSRRAPYTLTHAFPDTKTEGLMHEAEYNFHLLRPLDILPPEEIRPLLIPGARAETSLDEFLFQKDLNRGGLWIAMNPSASCPSKKWPAARFAELADALVRSYGAAVFLIGGSADRAISQKIRAKAKEPIVDLTGKLSLGMLGAFFKRTALLVSNDTGPVHMAAAVGTPVVSVFGRNQPGLSPTRWKPLGKFDEYVHKPLPCHPCKAHACEIDFLCLDAVTVKDVMDAVKEMEPHFSAVPGAVK